MRLHHPLGILDAGQPVNWAHHLNKGLVSWWLVSPLGHPSYRGGSRLRDLCRRNHGTLTNGPTWEGASGRHGGRGALHFDGSDDYVNIPHHSSFNFGDPGQFSVSVWVKLEAGTDAIRSIIDKNTNDVDSGSGTGWTLTTVTGSGATPKFTIDDGTASKDEVHFGSVAEGDGLWHHLTAVVTTTDLYSFVEGRQFTTAARTNAAGSVDNSVAINLGQLRPFSRNMKGWLDDVRIWNRALSAAEVWQLYSDSRRGYPGTLNRVRRVSWFTTGGGSEVTGAGATISQSFPAAIATLNLSAASAALGQAPVSAAALATVAASAAAIGQGPSAGAGAVTVLADAASVGSTALTGSGTITVAAVAAAVGSASAASAATPQITAAGAVSAGALVFGVIEVGGTGSGAVLAGAVAYATAAPAVSAAGAAASSSTAVSVGTLNASGNGSAAAQALAAGSGALEAAAAGAALGVAVVQAEAALVAAAAGQLAGAALLYAEYIVTGTATDGLVEAGQIWQPHLQAGQIA